MSKTGSRVALLSPFWGGNLGDAAILQALIDNLRRQMRSVTLVGVTMDADSMRRTHGIPGTTLVRIPIRFFSAFDAAGPEAGASTALGALRNGFRGLRAQARAVKNLFKEAAGWLHAFRFLRTTDLLVVAGGGQIDEEWGGPFGLPYSIYKWCTVARLTGTKVAFVSVGVCKLDTKLGHWFYRKALRRADYASARDPWSQQFMSTILGRADTLLVPDIAFSYLSSPVSELRRKDRLRIGISPIAYGRTKIWPTEKPSDAERYTSALTDLARKRLENGDEVVLFGTDGPDWILVEEMATTLKADLPERAEQLIVAPSIKYARDLLPTLAEMDAVVASRLHGVILSHLVRTPVLAVSYDRKVTAHMEQIGQAEHCIPFEEATSTNLGAMLEALVADRHAIEKHLLTITEAWRRELQSQYETMMRVAAS